MKALRTTKRKQGKGSLRRKDSEGTLHYCCLGIAVEVARKHGVPVKCSKMKVDGSYTYRDANGASGGYLLTSVLEWFGFNSVDPQLKTPDGKGIYTASATRMNDTLNYDFKKIADAFELTFLSDEAGDTE